MKRIEIKVIRMPSGKYLCKGTFGGMVQQSTPSNAIKWYGENGELDPYEIAHDWGGNVIALREADDDGSE